MELSASLTDILLHADGKALATSGAHGINVIPVSTVRVEDGKIWLINYFLRKTLENIVSDPRAALACWKGLTGYQIKGTVTYLQEGEAFEKAKAWVADILPDRVVKGLLILDPLEIYSVTPGES